MIPDLACLDTPPRQIPVGKEDPIFNEQFPSFDCGWHITEHEAVLFLFLMYLHQPNLHLKIHPSAHQDAA
jgi:hypothetical protein